MALLAATPDSRQRVMKSELVRPRGSMGWRLALEAGRVKVKSRDRLMTRMRT
jgi:hypothetical protein